MPWRFSDACRRRAWIGRHAGVRKPTHKPTFRLRSFLLAQIGARIHLRTSAPRRGGPSSEQGSSPLSGDYRLANRIKVLQRRAPSQPTWCDPGLLRGLMTALGWCAALRHRGRPSWRASEICAKHAATSSGFIVVWVARMEAAGGRRQPQLLRAFRAAIADQENQWERQGARQGEHAKHIEVRDHGRLT